MESKKLLKIIKELGGDKTDLDLIQGISDEDEMVFQAPKVDETLLLKDLQLFVKGLNIPIMDSDDDGSVQGEVVNDTLKDLKKEPVQETLTKETIKKVTQEAIGVPETKEALNVREMVSQIISGKTPKEQLIVEQHEFWYLNDLKEIKSTGKQHPSKVNEMLEKAKLMWAEDVQKYDKVKQSASKANRDFISTVLKSGTVTDKVSALTLLIQESPVHSFSLLENLLGMAKKKARREALLAIDSIKDLMLNSVLPDRPLKFFVDQPVLHSKVTNSHLVVWCFEDALKKAFFDFVKILEELLMDTLPHVRSKVLSCVFELLAAKPEQEANLLSLLVNKLGDLDKKIASKAAHLLSQLLVQHPAMQSIVIKEVERLLLRPNVSDKARYYAITFLNQLGLVNSAQSQTIANELITLYFTIFESLVKQIKEKDVEVEVVKKDRHKKRGKRPSKYDKKKKPVKNEPAQEIVIDSVDSKMMAALLTGVNRAFPFSKLDTKVFSKHLDTLFMISHVSSFNTSIQALTLVFHVQSTRELISDRFYRALYDTLFDKRLYEASKQSMYLNLLYKALKEDPSVSRTRSFVKRLVQTITHTQVPFLCGSLFLISELFKQKPGLWAMVSEPEEDDEDEVFQDVDSEDNSEEKIERKDKVKTKVTGYDARKRDPLYANADRVCLWELVPLANHFHPTVALYAKSLLSGSPIPVPKDATNYDPLLNHTLTRFLDRFVYKAPKKVKTVHHGSSIMQPSAIGSSTQLLSGGRKKTNALYEDEEEGQVVALDDAPVNQQTWSSVEDVPADEVFFFKYFKEGKPKMEEVDDDQEIEDEDVWDAMTRSKGFDSEMLGDVDEDEVFEEIQGLEYGSSDSDSDAGSDIEEEGSDVGSDVEDSGDEMTNWANEKETASDEQVESDNDLDDDDLEEGVDQGFLEMVSGEESEVSEEEKVSEVSKKKKKSVSRIAERASQLGYSGSYFNTQSSIGEFASLEDFENLVNQDSESEQEMKQKKRTKSQSFKKYKKQK